MTDTIRKLTALIQEVIDQNDAGEATVKAVLYADGSGSILLWEDWAISEDGYTHAVISWDSIEHLEQKLARVTK